MHKLTPTPTPPSPYISIYIRSFASCTSYTRNTKLFCFYSQKFRKEDGICNCSGITDWTTFPVGPVSLRRPAIRPSPGRLLDSVCCFIDIKQLVVIFIVIVIVIVIHYIHLHCFVLFALF